eukprot:CAMPEP_0174899124 /NCGR_PEP_ID=MMETSP0167-20121228/25548_1 /TAXON_ID=38298 /ORGANISM="Rhodella maculata, Strain CCMP736" /LENGTH=69 /DNA_ID=CAMNT_0016139999 /DNA_START=109 /DNA_END=318 /DNA_ORIENTATION=+
MTHRSFPNHQGGSVVKNSNRKPGKRLSVAIPIRASFHVVEKILLVILEGTPKVRNILVLHRYGTLGPSG